MQFEVDWELVSPDFAMPRYFGTATTLSSSIEGVLQKLRFTQDIASQMTSDDGNRTP